MEAGSIVPYHSPGLVDLADLVYLLRGMAVLGKLDPGLDPDSDLDSAEAVE